MRKESFLLMWGLIVVLMVFFIGTMWGLIVVLMVFFIGTTSNTDINTEVIFQRETYSRALVTKTRVM